MRFSLSEHHQGNVPIEKLRDQWFEDKEQPYSWPWGWRTMWVVSMFDLPTYDREKRRAYARFRKDLIKDGFSMMQYSVYVRHCSSVENANLHIQRMRYLVPEEGEVRFLLITDRQFERMVTVFGKKTPPKKLPEPTQLLLF